MSKIIGLILNNYHTELLEFLFEIFNFYDFIIYIDNDDYNYIDILQKRYTFIQKSFAELETDYLNYTCYRYIVLSQTDIFLDIFYPYHSNVVYLIHNQAQLQIIESMKITPTYFAVSKSVNFGEKYVIPIIKKENNHINVSFSSCVDVVKIGWVLDTTQFEPILKTRQIKLHIFTKGSSPQLDTLKSKYKHLIMIHLEKSTEFIYNYINKNKIKYIFYNPETVDLWSGSISFALNNNMILLTNDKVMNCYEIPSTNCISISQENLIQVMKDKQIDGNCTELSKYKQKIFDSNLTKLTNITRNKSRDIVKEQQFIEHIFSNIHEMYLKEYKKFHLSIGTDYQFDYNGLVIDFPCDLKLRNSLTNSNMTYIRSKVHPDNILHILCAFDVPKQFWVLTVDIKSYDYFLLQSILTQFSPILISVQINPMFPPPIKYALKYPETNGIYSGQSLSIVYELFTKHEYELVSLQNTTLFAIKKTFLDDTHKVKSDIDVYNSNDYGEYVEYIKNLTLDNKLEFFKDFLNWPDIMTFNFG